MSDRQKVRITDVRTVGVPVTSQDRALQFYVGSLGFETRRDVPLGDGGPTRTATVSRSSRAPEPGQAAP